MKNLLYSLLFIFLLFACKDDDGIAISPPCDDPANVECPNYDPCYGKLPTTAEFTMSNNFGGDEPWNMQFYEDSIFFGGLIKFEAVDSTADYYQWIFGLDTLEGGPELRTAYRSLYLSLPPGQYSAKLKVAKNVDKTCFPSDSGRDSIQKSFYFEHNLCKAQVTNKFKGVFEDSPEDSIIIELLMALNRIPMCDANLHSINFKGDGDTLNAYIDLVGFVNKRVEWARVGGGVPYITGSLYVASDDSVVADYDMRGIKKKFRGRVIK
jgi:hypothetical protein